MPAARPEREVSLERERDTLLERVARLERRLEERENQIATLADRLAAASSDTSEPATAPAGQELVRLGTET